MCSIKYDFNISDLLCPKPLIITGLHDPLLLSISKHLEKFTILTDQIIHTLKMSLYTSVCNNTVVMWPVFIELIVSFYVKITQGKHREFHFG